MRSPVERHLQTGIQAVLVVLVIWVGNSVIANLELVTRLEERVAAMGAKITSLEAKINGQGSYVSRTEFTQTITLFNARCDETRDRVSRLEAISRINNNPL